MASVEQKNVKKDAEEKMDEIKEENNKTGLKRRLSDDKSGEEYEQPAIKAKLDDDVSNESPNDLEKKIIRQIEYYFGDANLCRDKFMLSKIAEDNGWIPLTVMLTFKRLASLSTDSNVIIEALKKSTIQLVQVSEDKLKLRRAPEIPIPEFNEERRKELMSRTAYVKGFPLNAGVDDILKWFEDKPNVESIHNRRYLDRTSKKFLFKGSVFVVFKTIDACEKFIESGPYNYDTDKAEFIVKWQEKYIEEKKKERQDSKSALDKLKQTKTKEKTDKKFKNSEINDCSIVHITGLVPETLRDDIKSKFVEDYEVDVRYVEYESGDPEAHIRLQGNDSGTKLIEKTKDEKVEINGAEVKLRALEGEELQNHIDKIKSDMLTSRNKHINKKNSNRGRKFKGRK